MHFILETSPIPLFISFSVILPPLIIYTQSDLSPVAELAATGFFRGIDVIIPVPLHPRKQKLRGYNQSECIARGVSAVTGIPIDVSSVLRRRHTETQTRKSAYERWENVDGIFLLRYPERFVGKHILIVDDVLTTGATTTACADALKDVGGVHVSILTLAVAGS